MSDEHYIDYSQLLSQLLGENDELNETVVSFLYHLFPRELFIRAMSLIDSNNMFIYVFEKANSISKLTESASTEADDGSCRSETSVEQAPPPKTNDQQHAADGQSRSLVQTLYERPHTVLNRLIAKQEDPEAPPVCVDLEHWFCSCEEYNTTFKEQLLADEEPSLYSRATNEVDYENPSAKTDLFACLFSKSSKRRYFRHDILMCPHLLAFAILLQTTPALLSYFSEKTGRVYLITIQNLDEWLKLHLNIVT